MSQKPTILFFAGAFADPSCFDTVSAYFHKAGYATAYAYVLSLNPSDPNISTSVDAEHTRTKYLYPLLEEGKDVIIFAHSYGGVVAGQAAAGHSKTTRVAEGKKGGVIGLLYLAGNIVGENGSLLEAVGGEYPPFIKQNHPSKGLAVISPVMETLYGDADPAVKPQVEAAMLPTALSAFETPVTAPAWGESVFDGRRAYIRTLDDQCNPLFIQNIWLKTSGVKWDVVDMKTSHCPFISRPEETANTAMGIFDTWA